MGDFQMIQWVKAELVAKSLYVFNLVLISKLCGCVTYINKNTQCLKYQTHVTETYYGWGV